MNSDFQQRLLGAIFACLVPMARLLLRYGITYRQFADVSKAAFVREAFRETDARGRYTNASRVAVKTGISRKEIRRLRDAMRQGAIDLQPHQIEHYGPPARVLHAWHTDRQFTTEDGAPRPLPFEDGEPSFVTLVRAVAGDVPPGAVRAELRRAGAVAEADDGRLVALKRFYVPGDADEKAVTSIASLLFPLAAGLEHNTNPARKTDGYIQRIAYTEKLRPGLVPTFRKWSRAEAIAFVEKMDDWLAAHEDESVGDGEPDSRQIVGIGVFYYEGPAAEDVRMK